jgi:putative ABC transport system ATP-binding protein
MESPLELQSVSVTFEAAGNPIQALVDVSLSVPSGQFLAVMGATGSGKSTLLNCAAGLERPGRGSVRLLGREISTMSEHRLSVLRRQHVGVVFQSYNLLSELTVEQNVLLPCRLGAKAAMPLENVLHLVGLPKSSARVVGALSGGQRQRVAIARALVTRPAVIFADEPTGALDPETSKHIMQLLRSTVDEQGATVVMVSHDPAAAAVSNRLLLLRSGSVVDDRRTPDATTIAELLHEIANVDDLMDDLMDAQ